MAAIKRFVITYYARLFNTLPPVCCHFFVVGRGLCTSMTRIAILAGIFILHPSQTGWRIDDRQSSSPFISSSLLSYFSSLYFPIISPCSMLYSSVYNLFALIGRKPLPLTYSYYSCLSFLLFLCFSRPYIIFLRCLDVKPLSLAL